MSTVFWAIVVLGALIFVHELGHFLVARMMGVRVLVFSLGFGPRIAGWSRGAGETEYRLSLIPLGGYVKMLGENEEEDEEKDQSGHPVVVADAPDSFANQGVWSRIAIVFAGPAFNFLFALMVLVMAFMLGVGELLPVVGSVSRGMPAEQAGLRVGDRVVAINEQPVTRWEVLSQTIKRSEGVPLRFTVERPEGPILLTIQPRVQEMTNIFGETVRTWLVGIGPGSGTEFVTYGFFSALVKGVEHAWRMTDMIVTGVWKIITRSIPADQIGGPLMIAEMAGKTAEQGASSMLFFMALISINLGILNLLPIPVLDGGHLLFFLIEAVKGSPLSEQVRLQANRAGMFLLIVLMAWAMKNDLTRIFSDG
ncbi:Metalloprotease MmpA [Candidatus Magnetaquicoccaceae bacterium FCR-1]|uniref:Zinc metalloprotease n=1 Tax=Candidatus Magnetaquiglobus chichijimensis TaxID=3141448 RepID=A0ABQ0C653_9PROT